MKPCSCVSRWNVNLKLLWFLLEDELVQLQHLTTWGQQCQQHIWLHLNFITKPSPRLSYNITYKDDLHFVYSQTVTLVYLLLHHLFHVIVAYKNTLSITSVLNPNGGHISSAALAGRGMGSKIWWWWWWWCISLSCRCWQPSRTEANCPLPTVNMTVLLWYTLFQRPLHWPSWWTARWQSNCRLTRAWLCYWNRTSHLMKRHRCS